MKRLLLFVLLSVTFIFNCKSGNRGMEEKINSKQVIELTFTAALDGKMCLLMRGNSVAIDWGDGIIETFFSKKDADRANLYSIRDLLDPIWHEYEEKEKEYTITISTNNLEMIELIHSLTSSVNIGECPSLEYLAIMFMVEPSGILNERGEVIKRKPLKIVDLRSLNKVKEIALFGLVELESIDLSSCTMLERLSLEYLPNLTSIDVSKNTSLISLELKNSKRINVLDVSKNTELSVLDCSRNTLTNLDLTNNRKLEYLYCSDNDLSSKLDLSGLELLNKVELSHNEIEELDITNCITLCWLKANNNNLKHIEISNTPKLDHLYLHRNALDKEAFNYLLSKLLMSEDSSGGYLTIKDNPAAINYDQSTIDKDKWKVVTGGGF